MISENIHLPYAKEKLGLAALHLRSKTKGKAKDRLYEAAREFSAVAPEDVPPSLRAEYVWIREQLSKEKAIGDEGTWQATKSLMSESTALDIADRICALSADLDRF